MQRGFSMIELLVAVAIVAILVAAAIPQYKVYTARAKRTEGVAILDGFHKSVVSYIATNNDTVKASISGIFPIEYGYDLVGKPKYYLFGNALASPYYYGWFSGPLYFVRLKGQLDSDAMVDELCISLGNYCPGSDGRVCIIQDDILH